MPVNAETLVIDWLNHAGGLNGWPASLNVPASSSSTHPTRFITVERVGGVEEPYRSMPLIAIQVWAETRLKTADKTMRVVLPRLKRLTDLPEVAAVDITGVTDFPTADGRPRYQITIQPTITSID